MDIARSLKSLPYKESRSVPHVRATQCAISLTYQTTQAQHNTEERACHSTVQVCGWLPTGETPMITQPNPQLEARPAAPDVQHRLPIHLPGRPRRPTPQGTRAIDTHIPNIALAGLQLLIGYEWLLAGGDKLLLG